MTNVISFTFNEEPTHNDEAILMVLEAVKLPLTPRLLTEFLNLVGYNIQEHHVHRILKNLEKYGKVRKKTVARASYWTVNGGKNE